MTKASSLELIREALQAARAKDKPRTRQLLLEATHLDSRNEAAWQWLAGVAESAIEANGALERVLVLNPNNEKAAEALRSTRLKAGIEAAKAKDAPAARRLLRAAVADDPRSEHGWLWLAGVTESPAEALAYLQRVLDINPKNPSAKKGADHCRARLQKPPAPAAVPAPAPETVTRSAPPTPLPAASGARRGLPASGVRQGLPTPPPMPAVSARTVLVVDDSRTIRKVAGLALSGAGYRVAEAESGMDAVERIRVDGPPDLILLDVAMPGMSGYEFCRLVRHNPETAAVPVVMLTGKDGFFDKLRGRLAGTDVYLTKPLQPEALLVVVRKLCPAAR